jgi:uncharacterized membrane protein
MKKSELGTLSLFPAVILFGILIGAIVYSHIAFLPAYLSDLPNSAVVVTGRYGINEAPFWMTIHPLLILSLSAALFLNRNFTLRRWLIAITFVIYIGVLIVTAVYFVPELLSFATSPESPLPAAEWRARGHRWQYLSLIRGAFCFAAFISLLIAFSRPAVGAHDEAPNLA